MANANPSIVEAVPGAVSRTLQKAFQTISGEWMLLAAMATTSRP